MKNIRAIGAIGAVTAVFLASLFPSLAAHAGQASAQKLMIAIDDGTDDGQIFIDLDDADEAVDIENLQVGESRSFIDQHGRSILITKTEAGLDLTVDGKVIELPSFDGPHTGRSMSVDADVDVDITRRVHIERRVDGDDRDRDAITIVSTSSIADATKDQIRSILSSSGHSGEIRFIDEQGFHDAASAVDGDGHRIKVISKETSATN